MEDDLLNFVDNNEIEVIDNNDIVSLENSDLNKEQASQITEAIRSAATATYVLLTQAYERKAHKALGYDSWADYVKEEFDMSASRSYQLLDLNRVIKVIESATPEGTNIRLTESQARDIKRELPRITERIEEETKELEPEAASAKVNEIIADERELLRLEEKAKAEKQKALEEAEEQGYQKGLEAAADAMLEQAEKPSPTQEVANENTPEVAEQVSIDNAKDGMRIYNFINFANNMATMGEPEDFLHAIPEEKFGEFYDIAVRLSQWFKELVKVMER